MKALIVAVFVLAAIIILLELIRADTEVFFGDTKRVKVRILFFTIDTAKEKKKKEKTPKKKKEKKEKKNKKDKKKDKLLYFSDFCRIAARFLRSFRKHLVIKKLKCHVSVATDDAANTALTYGKVTAGVNIFCGALCNNFNVKERDINVYADFNKQKIEYDIYVRLRLSALDVLLMAMAALTCMIKSIIKNKKIKKAV